MAADTPRIASRRKSIRFVPDAGTFAQIDLEPARPEGAFKPTVVALVPEESSKGVGLIALATNALQVGTYCRVQVGSLPPMKAEVRWKEEIGSGAIRLGLVYLE